MSLDIAADAFEPYDPDTGVVAELADCPRLFESLSATSFRMTDGLSYDQYVAAGRTVRDLNRSVQWMWVAWVEYGDLHFHQEYAQAGSDLGLSPKTLRNLVSVARAFPPSRRREALPFYIHEAVSGLRDPAEQEELLDQAEEHKRLTGEDMPRAEVRDETQRRKLDRGETIDLSERAARWADDGRKIVRLLGKGATVDPRDYGDTDALAVLVQRLQQAGGAVRGA